MKKLLAIIGCLFAAITLLWLVFHGEEANTLFVFTAISGAFMGLSGSLKE